MANHSIAAAWERAREAIRADPEKARGRYAPATATLVGGLKCRVTGPNGENVETDMARSVGGEASGPAPGWLFRASFAACCASVIAAEAARHGIDLTALEVTVEAEGDNRGMLGMDDAISAGHSAIRTTVRIGARNATPERLDELVRWADAHSPVGCTVRDAPANVIEVLVA